MKLQRKDSTTEKTILTALIVDKVVLGRVYGKGLKNPFKNKWSNLICGWCFKYYAKYEDAPKRRIENIFNQWSAKTHDSKIVDLIETFLATLSEEYEQEQRDFNSLYVIDLAGMYFNQVHLETLRDKVSDSLSTGEIEETYSILASHHKIELGGGEGIDVMQDQQAIKQAFEDKKQPLINYPGALGRFFKDALERDAFVAFLGPEKSGKSFHLSDIAFRGALQRKKVAYFEAGDMSQNQVLRRLMTRISKRPLYPGKVKYPITITKKDKDVIVETQEKIYKEPLSWQQAYKACENLIKKRIKSKHPYLRLSCHSNSTLSVRKIRSILADWEREDWVPDIIVIDYADILDMSYPGKEGRECINETWKQLRSISQDYHCLLVTATQANAAAYDTKILSQSNFSEDKRKIAHVTGMIGINVQEKEQAMGIVRLNWIVLRESKFNIKKCVYVARCLSIANPTVKSCF